MSEIKDFSWIKLISFVIPAYNEAENLGPLVDEINKEMGKIKIPHEIIIVNDGSNDDSPKIIDNLFQKFPGIIRGIEFRHNFGKAAALRAGFDKTKGNVIIQMDADLQDDPVEIGRFLTSLSEGNDLVCGWKQNRKDSFIKNKTSKVFNYFTNLVSGTKLHDHNCGFKAYRSEVVDDLNLYGELHRYIPVIAASQGFKVAEVPVSHRKRYSGKSKYGSIRFIHGGLDLLTILFITRYRTRPLHLFGYLGLTLLFIGLIIDFYMAFIRLFEHAHIGDRPLLTLGVMLTIVGMTICSIGLVGEQITSMLHSTSGGYKIKRTIGGKDN